MILKNTYLNDSSVMYVINIDGMIEYTVNNIENYGLLIEDGIHITHGLERNVIIPIGKYRFLYKTTGVSELNITKLIETHQLLADIKNSLMWFDQYRYTFHIDSKTNTIYKLKVSNDDEYEFQVENGSNLYTDRFILECTFVPDRINIFIALILQYKLPIEKWYTIYKPDNIYDFKKEIH